MDRPLAKTAGKDSNMHSMLFIITMSDSCPQAEGDSTCVRNERGRDGIAGALGAGKEFKTFGTSHLSLLSDFAPFSGFPSSSRK